MSLFVDDSLCVESEFFEELCNFSDDEVSFEIIFELFWVSVEFVDASASVVD